MDNTVIDMNYLDLVRDCLCEYVIGAFYSQLTYKIITAFLINDKAIIHTCNGQTIIECGLEPSENIIKRMKEIDGKNFTEDGAISLHIGAWEITALTSENTVHITQK
ncbi:hypothetical protein QA584_08215 [Anaerocolumna sp. AGMB13025]|uniref:hypothetical protein n=1 Tax=Anaerocolumna sp. AGMB13025 TaxID=3039116 RepID=UPI00241EFE41|nr:hypothetical protein [Anaerocolumna sp. AGMB13025]WFR59055.1 hypothetical protein QA584_08215 [Anaerocolumna sp. AGMB13025]